MFEKVNPAHPDKIADRIAGAIVDAAYALKEDPIVACEVLIGHGKCYIILETNVEFPEDYIEEIVKRISNNQYTEIQLDVYKQDEHLEQNQAKGIKCGDNGIFKGVPINDEEKELSAIARAIYANCITDGKYIIDNDNLIICQSYATDYIIKNTIPTKYIDNAIINPLGEWTGGLFVDSGATNRKLGSDMGRAVTGGGLHGKDLSKADVAVNIYAFIKAQETGKEVNLKCAIGDAEIDGKPYSEIVAIAKEYITKIGGFEKLAEWGLI